MSTFIYSLNHSYEVNDASSPLQQAKFKELLASTYTDLSVDEGMVDSFIKNAHQIKVLRGKKYGALEADKDAVSAFLFHSLPLFTMSQSNPLFWRSGCAAGMAFGHRYHSFRFKRTLYTFGEELGYAR